MKRIEVGAQGRLTVGFGAGALLAGSGGGSGRLAALVTSLRFDPVELATRLILPLAWPWPWPWPFFSLGLVALGSESSCAAVAREALDGGMENAVQGYRVVVLWLASIEGEVLKRIGIVFVRRRGSGLATNGRVVVWVVVRKADSDRRFSKADRAGEMWGQRTGERR